MFDEFNNNTIYINIYYDSFKEMLSYNSIYSQDPQQFTMFVIDRLEIADKISFVGNIHIVTFEDLIKMKSLYEDVYEKMSLDDNLIEANLNDLKHSIKKIREFLIENSELLL